jgi:DNA polymerase-3 subunit beta
MKFTCLIENLKKGVVISEKITNQNLTLPVLSNILLTADGNKLKISATDLELGLNYFVPGKVDEKGSILIPSRIFNSVISNFKGDKINLETNGNKLIIKTDQSDLVIQGGNEEEFPIIPSMDSIQFIEMNNKDLEIILNQVIRSAGAGLSKPELNSVYCYQENKELFFVSTDTFRLSEKRLNKNQYKENISEKIVSIMPIKTAQEVLKIIQGLESGSMKIFINTNQIFFDFGNANLISRLIEGEYIQYKNIIPTNFETEGMFDKKELVDAIRLVSLFSSKVNDIFVEIDTKSKELIIKSQEVSVGQGVYKISGDVSGKDVVMSFNYRYLLDGLESLQGNKVFMGFNQDRPVLLRSSDDESYIYITAPIKI